MFDLYLDVEPFNLDVNLDLKPLCRAFRRSLCVKLLSETFMANLFAKGLCGTGELLRVEPVCGTLGNLHLLRTFKGGPWGT